MVTSRVNAPRVAAVVVEAEIAVRFYFRKIFLKHLNNSACYNCGGHGHISRLTLFIQHDFNFVKFQQLPGSLNEHRKNGRRKAQYDGLMDG
jgi:hypothetical protein